MPGRSAEQQARLITQLGFDSLTELSVNNSVNISPEKQNGLSTATPDVATFGKAEVYRPAPRSRRKAKPGTGLYLAKKHATSFESIKQATLDDLFTSLSLEADILPSLPISSIRAARHAKQNGQYTQLGRSEEHTSEL